MSDGPVSDPIRCFEIRNNLLNLAAEVIGHDTEDTAAEGILLSETVYYADGTRAGVTTPDDGYWTTRYIGSLIYEGEICTKEVSLPLLQFQLTTMILVTNMRANF